MVLSAWTTVDSWLEISVKQTLFLQYCSFGQTEHIFICEMSDKRNDVTIIIIWSLQGCDARKKRHSHTSDSAAVLCCPQWVTLVTKPEVHNMRRTKPQPGNMCRKFGEIWTIRLSFVWTSTTSFCEYTEINYKFWNCWSYSTDIEKTDVNEKVVKECWPKDASPPHLLHPRGGQVHSEAALSPWCAVPCALVGKFEAPCCAAAFAAYTS